MGFERVTILGVGLIGASFALAIRKAGLSSHITGFGRTEENLRKAKDRGIIDAYEKSPGKACEGSELVVFATPVGAFIDIAKKVKRNLPSGALAMDVGSVKGSLVYEMEKILPNFVGCHPIAGGDRSGMDSANAGLFKGALAIITKTDKTDEISLGKVVELWKTLGSKVEVMDAHEHDRVYALVSHMPHLVAYALVNTVADAGEENLRFAGPGFKDATRIAASSPELWRDICFFNRDNILYSLEMFRENIDKLSRSLKKGDKEGLEGKFRTARSLREGIE